MAGALGSACRRKLAQPIFLSIGYREIKTKESSLLKKVVMIFII